MTGGDSELTSAGTWRVIGAGRWRHIEKDVTAEVTAPDCRLRADENPNGGGIKTCFNVAENIAAALRRLGNRRIDKAYPHRLHIDWKIHGNTFRITLIEMTYAMGAAWRDYATGRWADHTSDLNYCPAPGHKQNKVAAR